MTEIANNRPDYSNNGYLITNDGFRALIRDLSNDSTNAENLRKRLQAALKVAEERFASWKLNSTKIVEVLQEDQIKEISQKWDIDVSQFAPLGQIFLHGLLHAGLPGGDSKVGIVIASMIVREAKHLEKSDSLEKTTSLLGAKNNHLESKVTVDELTGAKNRLQYNLDILELTNTQEPRDFTLVMIDLDFFKKINDTYGHI